MFLTQSLLRTLTRYEQVGRRRVWRNTQRSQWRVELSPSYLRADRKAWTWSPALRRKPRSGSAVWRRSSQTWRTSLLRRKQSSILFKRLWHWSAIQELLVRPFFNCPYIRAPAGSTALCVKQIKTLITRSVRTRWRAFYKTSTLRCLKSTLKCSFR